MRLLGKRFVPGFKLEGLDYDSGGEDQQPTDDLPVNLRHNGLATANVWPDQPDLPDTNPITGDLGQPAVTADQEDSSTNDDEVEVEEGHSRSARVAKSSGPDPVVEGVDWESVNYTLSKLPCKEDDISGLDVCQDFVVVQYYIEPGIDVYDRRTLRHLFRLEGHEYGGQCLWISEAALILYSASMDCTLKCWNLSTASLADSASDHCDYVQCLAVHTSRDHDLVATGGRGDKAIFVYKVDRRALPDGSDLKLDRMFRLQGHKGWISQIAFVDHGPGSDPDSPEHLISGSEDATIRIWDLKQMGACICSMEQDSGISVLVLSKLKGYHDRLVLFGDRDGKMSYLDLGPSDQWPRRWCTDTKAGGGANNGLHQVQQGSLPDVVHILPNVLIGTGKYCRSCKYHDKAVDIAFATDNGYLITASAGSKFVKIWKFSVPFQEEHDDGGGRYYDLEATDVRELQVLRDHTDYLSVVRVFGDTIYSSCSDGHVYAHTFPMVDQDNVHYDMAFDDDQAAAVTTASATATRTTFVSSDVNEDKSSPTLLVSSTTSPQNPTEVCQGPRLCRTGKTGLFKSSSSFQVSVQLKPNVCSVDGRIKLKPQPEAAVIAEEDESDPESSDATSEEDGYEVIYYYDSD